MRCAMNCAAKLGRADGWGEIESIIDREVGRALLVGMLLGGVGTAFISSMIAVLGVK